MACSNEKDVEIDVPLILNNVALFENGLKGERSSEMVFIVGSTGSGKTTVMNIMADKPLQIVRRKGTHRVDVVDGDYAGEISTPGYEKAKIVDGADSGTSFPNYTLCHGVEVWDCPGDRDTRTTENELANKYYVHKIMSVAAERGGVKLIVVQDHNSCSVERGSAFKNSIRTLCDTFEPQSREDIKHMINATTFVFNKVPVNEMNSDNPMQYLEWRLELVDTQISRNRAKYPEWATATFISLMKECLSTVRHVEIPQAQEGFEDFVRRSVLDPDHGVWAKVCSTHSLKNFPPRLAVSDDKAAIAVLKVNAKCQLNLKENCETLKELLKAVFEKLAEDSLPSIIQELLKKLRIDKSSLDSGGASRVSLDLIQYLEVLEGPEEYKQILHKMKTTIKSMQFFNCILRNSQAGSDFTVIIDAAKYAAGRFISAREKEDFEVYSAAHAEYIEKQNSLSRFKIVLAGCFTAFATLFKIPVEAGFKDAFIEVGGAIYSKVIGCSQEPSTARMNESSEMKKSFEEI